MQNHAIEEAVVPPQPEKFLDRPAKLSDQADYKTKFAAYRQ